MGTFPGSNEEEEVKVGAFAGREKRQGARKADCSFTKQSRSPMRRVTLAVLQTGGGKELQNQR